MTLWVEYWKENLSRSFRVWEKTETASVLAGMVIAAILAVIPGLGVARFTDTPLWSKMTLGLVFWFSALVLVVTPMRMWGALIDRLRPRISAYGNIREQEHGLHKTAVITVKNNGARITNAVGRLERVYGVTNGKMELIREVQPVRLQWSSRDGGGQSIDIDKEADLDVVFTDCSGDGCSTIVAFDPELRHLYRLPERSMYKFIISIGADKLVPVQYECKFTIGRLAPGRSWDLSFEVIARAQLGSQVSKDGEED